jgi:hypothetical protein
MMEAVRTSETSVDNHFTRQYIPEDNSEHHTRRRENLKYHIQEVWFVDPQISSEDEVGGACGTHGRGEESVQGFGGKARRKETTRKT